MFLDAHAHPAFCTGGPKRALSIMGILDMDRWELGSEFHWMALPPSPRLSWPDGAQWYLLGRHAPAALLAMPGGRHRTLFVPTYFCHEVSEFCRQFGRVVSYRDDPRWPHPDWDSLQPGADDLVIAVNYFGARDGRCWLAWRDTHPCFLLEDHSQDPFSPWARSSSAEYVFCSVRKTVPVPDGGVLWSPRGLPLPPPPPDLAFEGSALKLAAMACKTEYLAGHGPDDLKPRFRKLQAEGEQRLREAPISPMPAYSVAYVSAGVPAVWRQQRLVNVRRLVARLASWPAAKLLFTTWPEGAVPFNVVLVFPSTAERDHYQRALQRRNIFAPVHWVCDTADADALDLSGRVLSLYTDHRYTEQDMDTVADALFAESFAQRVTQ